MVDEKAACREWFRPDVIVDAILAKKNLGTKITDAPFVIGVGPGFTAGTDCNCVVETKRGHTLGNIIWRGERYPEHRSPGKCGRIYDRAADPCRSGRHTGAEGERLAIMWRKAQLSL